MIQLFILIIIVFLLTYDPKSRTLDTLLSDCQFPSREFGTSVKCPPPTQHYLGVIT